MKSEEELFYKFLGSMITTERKRFGITQEKLAEVLELSRVSIVNIEKGNQKLSIFQLLLIAEKFNLTLDSFVGGYLDKKHLPSHNKIHGREVDEKSLMEVQSFKNLINK